MPDALVFRRSAKVPGSSRRVITTQSRASNLVGHAGPPLFSRCLPWNPCLPEFRRTLSGRLSSAI